MSLFTIASMAAGDAAKLLFLGLTSGLFIMCLIGFARRRAERLWWLLLSGASLTGVLLSAFIFAKDLLGQLEIMFPTKKPIETWDGMLLFLAVGLALILALPIAAGIFESMRALAICYFKTESFSAAGNAAGAVLGAMLERLSAGFRKVLALDFGGRYD